MLKTSKKKLFQLLILLILSTSIKNYIQNVIEEEKEFNSQQKNLKISTKFSEQKNIFKKYTIWGWFKFQGDKIGLSNILIIKKKNNKRNNSNFKNEINIENEIYLKIDYEITNKGDSYLIEFSLKNDIKNNFEKITFFDLRFEKNIWVYFAVSCDYNFGMAFFYLKEFNVTIPIDRNQNIALNNFDFKMEKENDIIFSSDQVFSDYPFEGFISNVAFAPFFTNFLEILWMSYLPQNSFYYNGIILQIFFKVYNKNSMVRSKGLIEESFVIDNYLSLYEENNKSSFGVKISSKSSLDLGFVDFKISESIKSCLFIFDIIISSELTDNFILLERGNENIIISIIKKDNGRIITFKIKEEDGNQITWKSKFILKEEKKIFFAIGIIISPASFGRIIYYDENNIELYELNKINFDLTNSKKIFLFKQKDKNGLGFVNIYRFDILNSVSSVIFKHLFKNIGDQNLIDKIENCDFKTDYYKESFKCLKCLNSILDENKSCKTFCDQNEFNGQNDFCEKCEEENCKEMELTTWDILKLNENEYKLTPTKKILNSENLNFEKLFKIKINSGKEEISDFTYKTNFDNKTQIINYNFDFKKKIIDRNLEFIYKSNNDGVYYDENRNIIRDQNLSIKLKDICFLKKNKKNSLTALAIIILVIFFITFFLLIIITLYIKKIKNILFFWKFFLHSWMNFQLLTFFLFIGIKIPCCVKKFLSILYLVTVKWDYGLRWLIDIINEDKLSYKNGLISSQPENLEFNDENVKAFILHNMGILFIIHFIFLIFYIIMRILFKFRKFIKQKKKFLSNIEFSVIIIIFVIFHMQIFVFVSLNLKKTIFTNFYFVLNFIISLIYIILISLGFLYFGYRLFGSTVYFMDSKQKDKFSYFFLGHKKAELEIWWNSFDYLRILIHFLIGVIIGVFYKNYLFQTIAIFILILIFLISAVIFRPWIFSLQIIWEIFSLIIIWIISIFFLVIATKDNIGCSECIDREGLFCWFIVILIFFICVGSCVLLWVMLAFAYYKPEFLIFGESTFKNVFKKNSSLKKNKKKKKNENSFSMSFEGSEDNEEDFLKKNDNSFFGPEEGLSKNDIGSFFGGDNVNDNDREKDRNRDNFFNYNNDRNDRDNVFGGNNNNKNDREDNFYRDKELRIKDNSFRGNNRGGEMFYREKELRNRDNVFGENNINNREDNFYRENRDNFFNGNNRNDRDEDHYRQKEKRNRDNFFDENNKDNFFGRNNKNNSKKDFYYEKEIRNKKFNENDKERNSNKNRFIEKQSMSLFIEKMRNEREKNIDDKKKHKELKQKGFQTLVPDSEDEHNLLPEVIDTLINYDKETEKISSRNYRKKKYNNNNKKNNNNFYQNRNDFQERNRNYNNQKDNFFENNKNENINYFEEDRNNNQNGNINYFKQGRNNNQNNNYFEEDRNNNFFRNN